MMIIFGRPTAIDICQMNSVRRLYAGTESGIGLGLVSHKKIL